ncbi:hypothetical protein OIU74_013681 [Salix koriyanagi]|uniref:Uncharacterized protein n=1 Tax=Salix koriyanagi TaxID=2511006 RepID=A0A9Q0T6T1_9ROSI|nr:hypothetical protein OIU74_013681 [Salix koriyanagi]
MCSMICLEFQATLAVRDLGRLVRGSNELNVCRHNLIENALNIRMKSKGSFLNEPK